VLRRSHALEKLVPAAVRHADVRDEDVGRGRLESGQGGARRVGQRHLGARLLERDAQELPSICVVVYREDGDTSQRMEGIVPGRGRAGAYAVSVEALDGCGNGQADGINLAGQGAVNLSAPTSGIYKGLMFFQDRTADEFQDHIRTFAAVFPHVTFVIGSGSSCSQGLLAWRPSRMETLS